MTNDKQLMAHVENIAKWVRLSGSPEEAKAFDYIEDQLKEWEVEYTRQTHQAYISLPDTASLTITIGDQTSEINCITHAMGASTPKDGLMGNVEYVKKGSIEDYKNFTRGSIALIDGLATPGATLTAGQQGAAAVIFVNGNKFHEMIVSPVWGSPTTENLHLLPKIPVISILSEDADPIKASLEQSSIVRALINATVLTEWRPIPLLVAEVKGNKYPDEVVFLSGHVDSWHYGAMDNASANAVQLEVLRAFQARKEQLKRTLRVVFWSGHSHGRYAGSTWYVDEHWEALNEELAVQMYVDSVGGKGATILTQAWAMAETKHVAVDALELELGEKFEGTRFGRGGDQTFYGIGVSSLFMCLSEQPPIADPNYLGSSQLLGKGKTGGLGDWWHAVDDTIDKLDPKFLERDARIYLYSIGRYLEDDQLALDFRPTVVELRDHLTTWQQKAEDRFLLDKAFEKCDQLEEKVKTLYDLTNVPTEQFNKIVMKLGRLLIPLNFTTVDKFSYDLALEYPPIPAFAPIHELQKTQAGSGEEKHVLVLLKRRLNYVTDSLHKAVHFLNKALENYETKSNRS